MKKNLFMVAAVALMALVSCNKEEINNNDIINDEQIETPSDIVFVAEFDNGSETKTALGEVVDGVRQATWVKGDAISITWVKGDAISINGTTFTADADGARTEFTTTSSSFDATVEVFRAVYPSTSYKASAVVIPVSQNGTFANASIAVAESNDQSLKFSNVSSILKFQVPAACTTVTFESTNSIAGQISIKYTDGVMVPDYTSLTNPQKKISVAAVGGFVTGKDYYVAVKPGDHQFTVSIDGNVSKASTKSVTVERSKILNMGVLPMPKLPRNLAFSVSEVSATRGTDLTEPVLSGVAEGVVYTSSNTAVAIVNAATGDVTMLAKGTAEITAYVAESNTHMEGTVSYILNVLPIYYGVYVCISDLGWSSVNMHQFTSAGDITTWPGEALNEKKTIADRTYYKKEVEEGTTLSFTYNNGKASSNFKIDVKDVTVNEDVYYRLSARGAIEIDPNDVNTFGYAIYVFDQKSKNVAPNLYAWDDGDAWKTQYGGNFSSWPGVAFKNDCYYVPADGQNWKHYYYYEIPTALYGKSFKFIVNKTGKTADQSVTKLAGDLYVGYWYDSASSNGFWTNANLNTPITK